LVVLPVNLGCMFIFILFLVIRAMSPTQRAAFVAS